MTMVRYSYCTTNYNKADVIEESVTSMLSALPNDGEVIVLDGGSTDESIAVLDSIGDERLVVEQEECNMGIGRQRAFELSSGDIVVQHFDTDRVYDVTVREYLRIFEELEEKLRVDDLVLATFDSLYISRRDVMAAIGGWAPTSRAEERIFTDRILENATLRILPVNLSSELPTKDISSPLKRAKKWRLACRDKHRVGFSFSQQSRFHRQTFPLPKALIADVISLLGWFDARGMKRYGRDRISWQEIPSWQYALLVENGLTMDHVIDVESVDLDAEANLPSLSGKQ